LRLTKTLLVLAVFAVAGVGLTACGGALNPPARAPIHDRIEAFDFGFRPEHVIAAPGATVRWINVGETAHTVRGEGFFSGRIRPGEDYELNVKPNTLRVRGGAIPSPEYRYHCTLHPRRMHGTIEVTGWR
jgi:plastocyanin